MPNTLGGGAEFPVKVDPEELLISSIFDVLELDVDDIAGGVPGHGGTLRYPDPVRLDQTHRRMFVRSLFALIEGVSHAMKRSAVRHDHQRVLSAEEVMLARDESVEANDSGHAVVKSARIRFLPNVRLAFRLWAKIGGFDCTLDVAGIGWSDLKDSVKLRDRLMHPKGVQDLEVSDDEIRQAMRVHIWFNTQLGNALQAVIDQQSPEV
jgi:hypothetical protein